MRLKQFMKLCVLRFAGDGNGVYRVLWGPLRGYRLVLGPDDRKLYILGLYERRITEILRRECTKGGTAIDLGSHVGYFTLLLASLTRNGGRVVAFEPNPSNAERIRRTLALNHLGHVTLVEAAVSDRSGSMQFAVEETGSMGRLVSSPESMPSSVRVSVVSLDDVAGEHDLENVSVIKMDIEGAEAGAIHGMRRLIGRCRPVIVCEWHPHRANAGYRETFDSVGYRCELLERVSTTEAFHIIARPI
jgi:FkbM family methyltransferase